MVKNIILSTNWVKGNHRPIKPPIIRLCVKPLTFRNSEGFFFFRRLISGRSNCLSSPTKLITEFGIWLPPTQACILLSYSVFRTLELSSYTYPACILLSYSFILLTAPYRRRRHGSYYPSYICTCPTCILLSYFFIFLTTPTQPRGPGDDHEVEDLRRVSSQRLNLPLQTIWSWRRLSAPLLLPQVFAKEDICFRQTLQHGHGSPHSPPLPGLAGLPSFAIPPSFSSSGLHPDPFPSWRRRGLRSSVGVCLPPRACPTPPTPPDGEGEGGGGMGKGGERGCRAISALSPCN